MIAFLSILHLIKKPKLSVKAIPVKTPAKKSITGLTPLNLPKTIEITIENEPIVNNTSFLIGCFLNAIFFILPFFIFYLNDSNACNLIFELPYWD